MLSYAQQLLRAASGAWKQRTEAQCPVSGAHKGKLKPPFLKVEDQSRQFRPFHHQFKSFPDLNLLAPKGSSPFEPPKNLSNSCRARAVEGSNGEKSPRSTAVPKKRKGFCECCQETFEELQKHLQSPQHRRFALDDSHYALVDRVISQLTSSITGQLPRVPLSCLTDEHSMPQAQRAAGAEVLTAVLGEERQQGAVGLLSADPDPDIEGCSSCLPRDGVSDPTEAEEPMGSCPLELPVGSRAATAAPSEPHRLLHTPPACRKRPLCPTQPTPLGKKPRVELGAIPTPSPVFPHTPPCGSPGLCVEFCVRLGCPIGPHTAPGQRDPLYGQRPAPKDTQQRVGQRVRLTALPGAAAELGQELQCGEQSCLSPSFRPFLAAGLNPSTSCPFPGPSVGAGQCPTPPGGDTSSTSAC